MAHSRPLAIDLCTGLHGWAEGLTSEGWAVRGYDIEDMCEATGESRPDYVELVLKSILDLEGAECADAALIVASPPCTEYSYMAMPWSRAKQIARALRGEDTFPDGYKGSRTVEELNALFNACFRIQREASAAAGRHIPMVVENVRGAQPWVGRAAANYGSYYVWGDVPALMPVVVDARKVPGFRFDGSGRSFQTASVEAHVTEGRKGAGAGAEWFDQNLCKLSSKSPARKAASAKIAKIPLALSSHIARVYRPQTEAAA